MVLAKIVMQCKRIKPVPLSPTNKRNPGILGDHFGKAPDRNRNRCRPEYGEADMRKAILEAACATKVRLPKLDTA